MLRTAYKLGTGVAHYFWFVIVSRPFWWAEIGNVYIYIFKDKRHYEIILIFSIQIQGFFSSALLHLYLLCPMAKIPVLSDASIIVNLLYATTHNYPRIIPTPPSTI